METVRDILTGKTDAKVLMQTYPEYRDTVLKTFAGIRKEDGSAAVTALIEAYRNKAIQANETIRKSGENPKTINAFLPDVIKARIALHLLEEAHLEAQSGRGTGSESGRRSSRESDRKPGRKPERKQGSKQGNKQTGRLNAWDGMLLQVLLFETALRRKAVSLMQFRMLWPFIVNKRRLMPLVNGKGIYCFYSDRLLKEVVNLVGNENFLEIGAGDGTLTRLLSEAGATGKATDDYSWAHYIRYPEFVEHLDAEAALRKYKPGVVICSWPPPGNPFEKAIFKTESVHTYLVIGSRNPLFSGAREAYQNPRDFTMEDSTRLASWVLPPSTDNAVYVFRRNSR